MRQNITVKQLNELSEKGKKKLDKWFVKAYQGWHQLYPDTLVSIDKGLPLLSMGQMIEFLDEKEVGFITNQDNNLWTVRTKRNSYFGEELCDALFEAVKEVLEK